MQSGRYARLFHILYHVAQALVLAMLVLIPIVPIELWVRLCVPVLLILVYRESRAVFSDILLSTFKLE